MFAIKAKNLSVQMVFLCIAVNFDDAEKKKCWLLLCLPMLSPVTLIRGQKKKLWPHSVYFHCNFLLHIFLSYLIWIRFLSLLFYSYLFPMDYNCTSAASFSYFFFLYRFWFKCFCHSVAINWIDAFGKI